MVQEAVTFPGSPSTKSLSEQQRFRAAEDKVDSSIQGSASVTPETPLINCWGSRCRGSHLWLELFGFPERKKKRKKKGC